MTLRRTTRNQIFRPLTLYAAALLAGLPHALHAQISLGTAVDLALRNSPRVHSAEADVAHAQAALLESKDVYIPTVTVGAAIGQAYGYSPYPPTLFNVNSGSLIYNASQSAYIRSARAGLDAARQALLDMRESVAEDAAITFVALIKDAQREQGIREQGEHMERVRQITEDRFDAGQDTRMDVINARLNLANLHLTLLRAEQDTRYDRGHMSRLIGMPGDTLRADGVFPATPMTLAAEAIQEGYGNASLASAFDNARAKAAQAYGDTHFLYRPQLSLATQYNVYATFTDSFSNLKHLYGNIAPDEFAAGVSINLPLLDRARRAKARQTVADAAKALHDAEGARIAILDGQDRLSSSVELLQAQATVAELEQARAEENISIVRLQLSQTLTGAAMTPKDEQNALINERDKFLFIVDTTFQLRQTEIQLLRQTGRLEDWLRQSGVLASAGAIPSVLPPPATSIAPPAPSKP